MLYQSEYQIPCVPEWARPYQIASPSLMRPVPERCMVFLLMTHDDSLLIDSLPMPMQKPYSLLQPTVICSLQSTVIVIVIVESSLVTSLVKSTVYSIQYTRLYRLYDYIVCSLRVYTVYAAFKDMTCLLLTADFLLTCLPGRFTGVATNCNCNRPKLNTENWKPKTHQKHVSHSLLCCLLHDKIPSRPTCRAEQSCSSCSPGLGTRPPYWKRKPQLSFPLQKLAIIFVRKNNPNTVWSWSLNIHGHRP